MPEQQSAVVAHAPFLGMHAEPHTNGGVPLSAPASSENAALGTQGNPQQSALLEHASPAFEPASVQSPAPVQRGMPRLSCWHASGF
jgi:hypothetical protein